MVARSAWSRPIVSNIFAMLGAVCTAVDAGGFYALWRPRSLPAAARAWVLLPRGQQSRSSWLGKVSHKPSAFVLVLVLDAVARALRFAPPRIAHRRAAPWGYRALPLPR